MKFQYHSIHPSSGQVKIPRNEYFDSANLMFCFFQGDYYLRLLLEEDDNESEEVSAIKKS